MYSLKKHNTASVMRSVLHYTLLFVIVASLASCSWINPKPKPPPPFTGICRGQDILSLAMQDAGMIAANLEQNQCIGVMQGTFGEVLPNLEVLLKTKKVPAFRAHIGAWCIHGASCYPGECQLNDFNCLGERARGFEIMAKRYPYAKCYLSPYAEYTSTNQGQVNGWFNAIRTNAPSCILVASPMGGYLPPNVLVERHGGNTGPTEIASTDGSSSFDINSQHYNTFATILSFHWTNRYNLRLTSEKGNPLPPLQRPLTNRISQSDFIQLQLLHRGLVAQPPAPAQCKNIHVINPPEIGKPHAEDYGTSGDARSNKPMFILKTKTKDMNILAPNGTKIACTKYYGPYTDTSLSRHYVGSCSGDDALSLYNKAGGEWAFLQDGATCTPITVLRRQGVFR